MAAATTTMERGAPREMNSRGIVNFGVCVYVYAKKGEGLEIVTLMRDVSRSRVCFFRGFLCVFEAARL